MNSYDKILFIKASKLFFGTVEKKMQRGLKLVENIIIPFLKTL